MKFQLQAAGVFDGKINKFQDKIRQHCVSTLTFAYMCTNVVRINQLESNGIGQLSLSAEQLYAVFAKKAIGSYDNALTQLHRKHQKDLAAPPWQTGLSGKSKGTSPSLVRTILSTLHFRSARSYSELTAFPAWTRTDP